MRPRLATAAILVVSLTATGLDATSATPAAAATGLSYTYDAAGRLVSAVAPDGTTARYSYDAVGNLLGISRTASAPVATSSGDAATQPTRPIALSAATEATVDGRDSVEISGAGLPVDSGAQVRIGGRFATIRYRSPSRVVADVPPRLPAGRTAVTVSGPSGTARRMVDLQPAVPPAAAAARSDPGDPHPLVAPPGVAAVSGRIRDVTGRYEEGIDVHSGRTTVLPWTTWLTTIDNAHAVRIPDRVDRQIVITTPAIPGLEVHVPPGTGITDGNGHRVNWLSITRIPLDRQPFPGAPGMPLAWTIQPGGATVAGPGLAVVYPNLTHQRPQTRIDYVDHDAERPALGWAVYGHGYVTPDGTQVTPDPTTRLHETYLLGVSYNPFCQYLGLFCPRAGDDTADGDPVDLQTGLFSMSRTDLGMTDVAPVALTRSYRQNDPVLRSFGLGQSDAFDVFVAPDPQGRYVVQLPDGRSIPFAPGTDGRYTAVPTPTAFLGATMTTDQHTNFVVTLTDGSVLTFGGYQASLVSQADRFGNTTTIDRDGSGRAILVTSPNGRWISLTWGPCTSGRDCIVQAGDNMGRTVSYGYDSSGRLVTMTNPAGKATSYGWASCTDSVTCTEITSVTDPLGIAFVRNSYDTNGRVARQVQPDGGSYSYSYTLDTAGTVTSTTVTDPRGVKRTVGYNSDGYPVSDTAAVGTPVQQATTYTRAPGTNLVTSVTDARSRRTSFSYDPLGHVLSVTRLAGTTSTVTDRYTYEPTYGRLATATNPLGAKQTYSYDDVNNVVTVTDPLGHATRTAFSEGQPVSVTDATGARTTMSYLDGDLVTVVDPLGKAARAYYDPAGRVLRRTDPLNNTIRFQYGVLDELLAATDGLGKTTHFTYDADGNRLTATDPLGHSTSYAYDADGRLKTRTDATGKVDQFSYDLAGNLTSWVDRNGARDTATYDLLGRPAVTRFNAVTTSTGTTYESTVTNTYDSGDRLTAVADTTGGTLSRSYDNLDRLTAETTPAGTVSYSYDNAGRRTAMTVAGQPQTTYHYDAANRLTSVSGPVGTVAIGYDSVDRRTSLSLPDGVRAAYGYDAASRPTALTYTSGPGTLGTLTYGYDAAGRRTSAGGTLASSTLPAATAGRTYNAVNELTSNGTTTLSYDAEGQLLSDGTRTYTWNARHQLTGLTGTPAAAFGYDPLGRRASKTIGGATTAFLYDGANIVQERSGGTPSANLLTGLAADETFARSDSAGTRSLLTDALGSTVALADSTGSVTTSYSYDPYGVTTRTGATTANSSAYAGRELDATSLYYNRARYYSPTLQRFISQDPLGESGSGANLYEYAAGSPTNYTDPTGEILPLLAACAGSALVNVGFGFLTSALSGRKYTWHDGLRDAAEGCLGGVTQFGAARLLGKAYEAYRTFRSVRSAEAAASATNKIYSARVLQRMAEDPGPMHNFPGSFDETIFSQGTRTLNPGYFTKAWPDLSNDSVQYRLPGTINGTSGTYEIFTRPSASGRTEVIMHRFFQPDPP